MGEPTEQRRKRCQTPPRKLEARRVWVRDGSANVMSLETAIDCLQHAHEHYAVMSPSRLTKLLCLGCWLRTQHAWFHLYQEGDHAQPVPPL